ncbi:complex 1 protein [Dictyocaulus viviparus]|uniref:Complex 1 protein n=1 Tax=Dictyocaulus viviparus TaxID=29172 RepID=A0A0D8XPQ5_DICVI|nr:complex 1 protein [Dictyocaulus viviparus]
MSQRKKVIELYKQLYYMGKEYPKGKDWFHKRLKLAFIKNKDENDPKKIDELITKGEFVVKEIEALYSLRKYRAMKNRYYEDK